MHWLAALGVGGAWLAAQFLAEDNGPILEIHMLTGMLVIYVLPVRYLWRILWPVALVSGRPWERRLARIIHSLLYFVMLTLPLTGIAAAEAGGQPVHFGGLITLLQFAEPNVHIRVLAMSGHRLLSKAMLVLVGLHVLAILKHTIVDRDHMLRRMLAGPGSETRQD
jgi:cytochrome b561